MFKKACILVLSLSLALAVTLGVSAHTVLQNEDSEITMCDLPFVRVSI